MRLILTISFFLSAIAFAENSTREQLSELHQIRKEIKNAVFDKARFQQDILKSKLDIENQNQEIKKTEKEALEIKEKIIERISTLYKIRRAYPEGSLLSVVKEDDFLRKSYYLKYLNAQDKALVTEYKSKAETTHRLKNKVQAYMRRLLELQKRNDSKFAELSKRENRQRELIRTIRETVRIRENGQIPKFSDDKKFFSELRGQLEIPSVGGELKGSIGIARDPKTKLAILKTGIHVVSKQGSEVRSVYDGEVLHSDNISGWGPTIIVDHGESYYSVYSRLKNLSVRPGDRVLAQQKLAEVSAVPYHGVYGEQGLYFEIRHYSEPEDPRLWLKGEQQ